MGNLQIGCHDKQYLNIVKHQVRVTSFNLINLYFLYH